ncbi:MAG: hypothetical protein U9N61_08900 [Euryarchaeota archaeon]|nr:hypothetical protein [Euryarchaeota archaeon]
MFKKGDIVNIDAVVRSGYDQYRGETVIAGTDEDGYRKLFRRVHETKNCMVVGVSHRVTGKHTTTCEGPPWDEATIGYLFNSKSHRVILVEPLHTNRWITPYACLESDVVHVAEANARIESQLNEVEEE